MKWRKKEESGIGRSHQMRKYDRAEHIDSRVQIIPIVSFL